MYHFEERLEPVSPNMISTNTSAVRPITGSVAPASRWDIVALRGGLTDDNRLVVLPRKCKEFFPSRRTELEVGTTHKVYNIRTRPKIIDVITGVARRRYLPDGNEVLYAHRTQTLDSVPICLTKYSLAISIPWTVAFVSRAQEDWPWSQGTNEVSQLADILVLTALQELDQIYRCYVQSKVKGSERVTAAES